MLRSLHVRGFKSLADLTVELAPLVVVFGPNAAGKSNLLEALVLLSRLVRERTLAEAFDGGIRGYPLEAFRLEESLDQLMRQAEAILSLEATLGRPDDDPIRYRVEVGIRPQTGELSVRDELLTRVNAKGNPKWKPAIERVDSDGTPRLHIRRKGKASHPFVEKAGLNHTLASNLQYSGAEHFPDFEALRGEIGSWRIAYLDPRESMRRAQPPREVDDLGERGEHLVPFLHRLQASHPKVLSSILAATRAVIPSIEEVRTELNATRGEVDLRVKQGGVWMSGRVVSEGTLRVLALAAMAANPFNDGLVAFEEPENGVHPRRIELVTRLLTNASRRRQVVVTTHSPLVVGEVLRLLRDGELAASDVVLLQCSGGLDGSRVRRFEPSGALFEDADVREALAATEDSQLVQAALQRGWLDG